MSQVNPQAMKSLVESNFNLFKEKNKMYGDTCSKLFEEEGFAYFRIMLKQKLNRINQLSQSDTISFESLEDSLIDLSNYALIAVLCLQNEGGEEELWDCMKCGKAVNVNSSRTYVSSGLCSDCFLESIEGNDIETKEI